MNKLNESNLKSIVGGKPTQCGDRKIPVTGVGGAGDAFTSGSAYFDLAEKIYNVNVSCGGTQTLEHYQEVVEKADNNDNLTLCLNFYNNIKQGFCIAYTDDGGKP